MLEFLVSLFFRSGFINGEGESISNGEELSGPGVVIVVVVGVEDVVVFAGVGVVIVGVGIVIVGVGVIGVVFAGVGIVFAGVE